MLLELARHGSLSATARALGITHVTVRRRVANLEADLDQKMFIRDRGRYVPTEAGRRVLAIAGPMADSADAVLRTVSGLRADLYGPVRVTATEAMASHFVLPGLKAIRDRYPNLELDLRVSQANVNLARSDADVAVRLSRPADGSRLIGHRAAVIDYHLFASRHYLEAHDPGDRGYIGYGPEYATWPEAKTLAVAAGNDRIDMHIDHLSSRVTAARLGLGVALLPTVLAAPWPELVRVAAGEPLLVREAYVVVHEDMKDVPRFKACVDVLLEVISSLVGDAPAHR